jgi:hypothetical protein
MGYTRRCPGCGARLTWTRRAIAGSSGVLRSHWAGAHHEGCRATEYPNSPDPGGFTFNPEDVIGPVGQPTWVVTASFNRINRTHVETVHVRANNYDGAILLARELFREPMIDAEAQRITDERMA